MSQTSALSARASPQCWSEQCGSMPKCDCGTTNVETPPKSYWGPCPSASLSTPQKSVVHHHCTSPNHGEPYHWDCRMRSATCTPKQGNSRTQPPQALHQPGLTDGLSPIACFQISAQLQSQTLGPLTIMGPYHCTCGMNIFPSQKKKKKKKKKKYVK